MDKPASKVCKLTKAFIDELRPDRNPDSKKRKRITCWDSEVKGFGIMVTPITETGGGGVKSYIFQYRMGGRGSDTRRVTIGHHGSEWQPHTARKQAEEYRRLWRQGIDPYEERKRRIAEMQRAYIEEGKEQAKADRLAFPRVREDFVEEYRRCDLDAWMAERARTSTFAEAMACRRRRPAGSDWAIPTALRR